MRKALAVLAVVAGIVAFAFYMGYRERMDEKRWADQSFEDLTGQAPEPVAESGAVAANYTPAQKAALAQCLKAKGVKLYGAWWCHWCKYQKQAFGDAAKDLPYVECSSPRKMDLLPVCRDAGVSSFPTWVMPDGHTIDGATDDLATLGRITGCPVN